MIALQNIYNDFGGNFWESNDNWNFQDPCFNNWYGVTCFDGHITGINLTANNLSGTLEEDNPFCDLPYLISLDLSENNLPGVLASCFFTNTREELLLHNNALAGPLPSTLADVQSDIEIRISNNQLTGCYPNELNPNCTFSDFSNSRISNGNNFDAPWDDFCSTGDGVCCVTNYNIDLNTVKSGTYYAAKNIELSGTLSASKSILLKSESMRFDETSPIVNSGSIEVEDDGCICNPVFSLECMPAIVDLIPMDTSGDGQPDTESAIISASIFDGGTIISCGETYTVAWN